jgi:hypothetical protein
MRTITKLFNKRMHRVFRSFAFVITLFQLCITTTVFAQSDGLPRGAYQMPYRRYEATSSSLGGGATLLSPSYAQAQAHSEATDRICASLSAANSSVNWNTTASGRGLVLRVSIPDGQNGSLALYVNNVFIQNISVTSKWAYQYFAKPGFGDPNIPSNTPGANSTTRMRFDEVRVLLANSIPSGANVRIQKGGDGINYLVDFIELEDVPAAVAFNASTMRNITEWGAIPNDGQDDMNAFNSARLAMQGSAQSLYIPAGTFNLSQTWHIQTNISIQGAGMWYTTLYFSNTGSGGIVGNGDNVKLRDFYMNTENTTRAEYKGLTGGYGNNSIIERLWVEHFETGAWITTWTGTITNGLRVSNCRFRNNYADGINLCRGTSNSIVEHSDFRNNGDDALATWSASDGPSMCLNNEFRYCTVENTWRAGGIGFFGGGGNKGHHLLIKDNVENGIRINSDFPVVGNSFHATLWTEVYETTVIGCGTNANLWHNRYGAVDIFTRLYNVQNFRLRNVNVNTSQKDAVMVYDVGSNFTITNVEFINVTINGAGVDGNTNNFTTGTYDDYAGYGIYVLSDVSGSMTMTGTNICNAPSGQIRNDSSPAFVINGTAGSTCSGSTNNAPVANAGADQSLAAGTTSASLSGSATDANGDPITYAWSQVSGPTSTINSPSSASTTVSGLSNGNAYVFRLTASDGKGGVGTDDVQITIQSAGGTLPSPWVTSDVGAVAATGSASHSSGTFTVAGSGADIWGTADEFRFVYQQITGDVTVVARVQSLTNTDAWAKAGVMIRATTAAGSQHAFTAVTPGNGLHFQRRTATNGVTDDTGGVSGAAPYWVRIQRSGNTFTSSVSTNGTLWTQLGSPVTIAMATTTQVGLAVTSHLDGTLSTGVFTNVSVTSGGGNQAPVANAGADQNLAAGTTSATLSGSGSDPNNDPITYAWSKVSGPAATIASPNSASTSVTGLTAGTYVFRLTVSDGSLTGTDDVQVVVQPSGGTQSPYPGPARHAIPGTIQTENFDNGGEGVAYHDIDATNTGGQYRTTGVDIETCSEGGFNVGWMRTGEWLEYSVNVATAGTYTLQARVATGLAGRTFHVEMDGVNVSGTITVPNTGGWQTWQTVSVTTTALTTGDKIMRIAIDSDDLNMNSITFATGGGGSTTYRIKNRWQNTYLYDAGDRVRYSATAAGTTYDWVLEDVGSGVKEIKNVSTGEYMHIENLTGYVQCTSRTAGWNSSRWTTEDAGSGFVRFKNVWQPTHYIHVENLAGHAQHGTINTSWMSAQWVLEPLGGGRIATRKEEEVLQEEETTEFSYWPTEVEHELHIQCDGTFQHVEVVDLLGRSNIRKSIMGQREVTLDVSTLGTGLHVVRMRGMKRTEAFRIIKKN